MNSQAEGLMTVLCIYSSKVFWGYFISGMRMVDEVGLTKVSDDFIDRIPFIGNLAWDPEACGIQSQGRVLYFYSFPEMRIATTDQGIFFSG